LQSSSKDPVMISSHHTCPSAPLQVPILVFVSDPVIIGPDTPPVLSVRNLILSNAPLGPDSSFPTSMLVGALWAVRFNR
jgi:hypothetical protein